LRRTFISSAGRAPRAASPLRSGRAWSPWSGR
jgi:hypothetical protein